MLHASTPPYPSPSTRQNQASVSPIGHFAGLPTRRSYSTMQLPAPPPHLAAARRPTVAQAGPSGRTAAAASRYRRTGRSIEAGRVGAFQASLLFSGGCPCDCPNVLPAFAPAVQPEESLDPITSRAAAARIGWGWAPLAPPVALSLAVGAERARSSLSTTLSRITPADLNGRTKYDLVLSSGFLAFANHCGFLQAGVWRPGW